MTYAKKVMKMSELIEMGFPKQFIQAAITACGCGWKLNPGKVNSPMLIDTEMLEQYRQKQIELEKMINHHRPYVM